MKDAILLGGSFDESSGLEAGISSLIGRQKNPVQQTRCYALEGSAEIRIGSEQFVVNGFDVW